MHIFSLLLTACLRSLDPFFICKLLNKLGQDFLDIVYVQDEYLDAPSVLPYNFQTKQQPMGDGQPMLLDHRSEHNILDGNLEGVEHARRKIGIFEEKHPICDWSKYNQML